MTRLLVKLSKLIKFKYCQYSLKDYPKNCIKIGLEVEINKYSPTISESISFQRL